jgi:O-antigen/teichoic acid export membrane protein
VVFKDSFLRHGSIIFFFSVIGYLSGYLFHAYMGRVLGPEDYGILGSLIAILSIATIPVGAVQIVIANFTSKLKTEKEFGKIKGLFIRSFRKLFLYGFFVFVLLGILSSVAAGFLNIPSAIPIILIGISIIFSFVAPVNFGVLQGLQNFKQLGLNQSLVFILRLGFGLLLVSCGFGLNGAALAFAVSTALVVLVTLLPLRGILKHKMSRDIDAPAVYRYYWNVLLVFAGFILITNIDVILAKHFFTAAQAGYYAAAAVLAKIAFFLSGIITTVMFPKAVEVHSAKSSVLPILKKGLLYMILFLALLVSSYLVMPDFIVSLFFGSGYYESAMLIGLLAIAMSFLAVSNVIAFYNMSVSRMGFVYILLAFALAEMPLLFLFHSTLTEFVWVIFFSMAGLLASLVVYMLKAKP